MKIRENIMEGINAITPENIQSSIFRCNYKNCENFEVHNPKTGVYRYNDIFVSNCIGCSRESYCSNHISNFYSYSDAEKFDFEYMCKKCTMEHPK